MNKKTGLVAFFDILGYQNFLKQNEPELAAEKISEFVRKVKDFPKDTFIKLITPGKHEKAEVNQSITGFLNEITCLIISDAIILTLEVDNSQTADAGIRKTYFTIYCSMLFNELFSDGFPPRGAIEYGDYILLNTQDSQLFAGKPIVDAYQSAINLDLSACQISDSLGEPPTALENHTYVRYNTPLKTGGEKELKLLMSFYFDVQENTYHNISDLTQFVVDSFTAHNKMIDKSVQNKIVNTELFLRYCKAVHLRKTF
jgi:hypothetical protein